MYHPLIDYFFSEIYGACLIIDDIVYLPLSELATFAGAFVFYFVFVFLLADLLVYFLYHLLEYLWFLIMNYFRAKKAEKSS